MAKIDGDSSSSVPNPNLRPSPINGHRPPQHKKSRTASGDAAPSAPDSPLFGGPLRPAVHRLTVAVDDPSDAPTVGGLLDRDWCYPSFLGGGVTFPSRLMPAAVKPARPQPPPPAASAKRRMDFSNFPQELRPLNRAVKETDERDHQDVSASSSSNAHAVRGSYQSRRAGNFLILSVLVVISLLSTSVAVSQRMRVLDLEVDIINIRRVCNGGGNHSQESMESLQIADADYRYSFGRIDSRMVALYAVVLSLLTPFILFKYLDRLPRINTPIKILKNSEEEVPLKKRIAYRVDVFFSAYPYAKLLALLFATILLIGFVGLALYAVSHGTLTEALWLSWTFVADSGNHADRVGLGPRIVSVSISSGGMLIFAMMLGLVSDAISEKVDSWRKGKSEVIERNHILILGWSDKLGSLLKQLAIANKSLGGGVVVVLTERDKEEMEMDIARLEFDFMGTSVICRSGSPLILADLKMVSVSKARAIIVLEGDENADQSDAHALRVVLSLTGVKEGLRGHVVVGMSDLDNEPLVKLVGGELIETVVAHDVIGRLMIQCALQPGLAQVRRGVLPNVFSPPKYPEKILFCGWRCDIDDMIMVLEAFLAPGSELWMFNEVPEKERERKLIDGGLDILGLTNITLVHKEGNAVIRRHLESLPLETFDSILILADESAEDSIVHSDSQSLATLLLIRDIQSKRLPSKEANSASRFTGFSHSSWIREMQQASDKSIIISEILDSRTRNLVSVSRISDYVLSNELVSMALAMVAEDKQINRVLEELFAEQGNEMCIRPAEYYLYEQEELCFYDIMLRGRERREIVIGYRLANADRAIINPTPKMEQRKWSIDDVFVVISLGE